MSQPYRTQPGTHRTVDTASIVGTASTSTATHIQHQVALAWHDSTCPDGEGCPSRDQHATTDVLVASGAVERFLLRLHAVLEVQDQGYGNNEAIPNYYLG